MNKRALRSFVRRTEKLPVAKQFYRGLYHLAACLIEVYARFHPELKQVFLRGSYARGSFRPGLSDLDFVLVVGSDCGDRELYRTLRQIERRFAQFRRLVPFLGELEILEEDTFPYWLQFAADRQDLRRPGGSPMPVDAPGQKELLRKAVADFVYLWLPNLTRWGRPELDRLFAKLSRLAGFSTPVFPREGDVRWAQTLYLLQFFEKACARLAPAQGTLLPLEKGRPVDLPAGLASGRDSIRTYLESRFDSRECLVVFHQEKLHSESLRACRESAVPPVLFTPSLFKFYLAYVSPLHAVSLTRDRNVWGEDIEDELSFSESDFEQGMQFSVALLMSNVLTRSVEPENAELHLLGWYLRYRRYFEEGAKDVYFHEVLDAYKKRDPAFFARINKVLENPDEASLFEMYRKIARDLLPGSKGPTERPREAP